jgi:hypothetical protein
MSPRRRYASLIAALTLLSACTQMQPEVVRPAGAPVYPPTQFVEMLDAPPTRPYQQIAVIELAGEQGALRTQVIAQIRTQAQQIGADAVILQDLSRTAPAVPRLNPTTGMYETTGGQPVPAFKGIAIKYR